MIAPPDPPPADPSHSAEARSRAPGKPSLGLVLAIAFAVLLYVALIIYHLRWLWASSTDLAAYANQHYPAELAAFQPAAGSREVWSRPLGWITELEVRPSTERVLGGTPIPPGGKAAPGRKYSARINVGMAILLTLVYATGTGIVLYAMRVLSGSFTSSAFYELPRFDDAAEPAVAWKVLSQDVRNAQRVAQELDRRSILFLVVGSVIAVVGVAALLIAVPHEARGGETASGTLLRLARSLGLVVFIEAVAWFFLKQHRVLIEDRKSFFRVYLRRANYLAALGLLPRKLDEAPEMRAAVVWALIRDPVSDRLRQGESTESIEAMRALGPSGEPPLASITKTFVAARPAPDGNP